MEAPTLQHTIKFPLHGHTVIMEILAYRKLCPDEIGSCVNSYVHSLKKKKLKSDTKIIVPTLFGASDPI